MNNNLVCVKYTDYSFIFIDNDAQFHNCVHIHLQWKTIGTLDDILPYWVFRLMFAIFIWWIIYWWILSWASISLWSRISYNKILLFNAIDKTPSYYFMFLLIILSTINECRHSIPIQYLEYLVFIRSLQKPLKIPLLIANNDLWLDEETFPSESIRRRLISRKGIYYAKWKRALL